MAAIYFLSEWTDRLPAQKSGGHYKTIGDEGFVAAVLSRVFRDGTGIFEIMLNHPENLTTPSPCYRFRFVRNKFAALAAIFALLAAMPALAHHSFSAEFDGGKLIELKGVVTRIDWANPHVYFYIDVKDDKGNTTNWGCEAASPGSLHRQGWNRDSLKVGDAVTVGGYPARDGSKLADARRVTLPDGRRIFGGTPGDGGPGDPKP
jgi:hypothetical protein